jgi:hypothetical protein
MITSDAGLSYRALSGSRHQDETVTKDFQTVQAKQRIATRYKPRQLGIYRSLTSYTRLQSSSASTIVHTIASSFFVDDGVEHGQVRMHQHT